jgi:protein-tyrosine phosphatase
MNISAIRLNLLKLKKEFVMNVLFVCLGNICRSPMAEVVFKDKVKRAGLADIIHVESRATSSWEHGNPTHPGTVKELARHGLSAKGIRSEQISEEDYLNYDLIIGMDQNNLRDLNRRKPEKSHAKIHLMLDVLHNPEKTEVPDPWYTGNFKETYELVDESSDLWLEKIQEKMN